MAKFSRGDIRDILKEAGANDEAIETAVTKLVRLHMDVVDPLKSENDTISGKDKEIEKLKSQFEKAVTELETLKQDDYKGKYEAEKAAAEKLKSEYETYKTEQAGKETRVKQETAFREVMKDNNIPEKHFDKIIRYSGDIIGKIEFDDKGKPSSASLKAAKDYLKSDWDDHVEITTTTGTQTPTPPANNGNSEFDKMSLADKMRYANEKPNDPAVKAWLQAK